MYILLSQSNEGQPWVEYARYKSREEALPMATRLLLAGYIVRIHH